MNTPRKPKKLEEPNDIFQMPPDDLVLWSAATGLDEWKGSLARAEQARRQTKAIHDFNRASSCLAYIMIAAAIVQVLIAVLKK